MQDVVIHFLTLVDFKETAYLKDLLEVFEKSKSFRPAKWKERDGYPKRPYNHNEIIQGIVENGEVYIPALYGGRNNPYEMIFFIDSSRSETPSKHLNEAFLRIKYPKIKSSMIEIFEFSSALSEIFKPEVGSIQFTQIDMRELGWMANMSNCHIQKNGLGALGVRTWFGAHAASQVGLDRLKSCGAIFRETSWGGIELDLFKEPWLVEDFSSLVAAQKQAMSHLAPSGVFGDYSSYPLSLYTPAPNWQPIPLEL
jgi:hypothetical protein